jgi:acetyl esterase/lipase
MLPDRQRRAAISRLFSGLLALSLPIGARAQHAQAPAPDDTQVRAAIAALGRNWNAEVLRKTARIYTPLHRRQDVAGIRRIRDLSYGPNSQQKFDLYVPDQGFEEPGPVIIYLHDGAATGSERNLAGTDDLFFGNVARWLARLGGVGINANYRLPPGAHWPSAAEDIRLLLDWVRANIANHGGDPHSILLFGNGEGATHVATYLFHAPSQPAGGPGIAGAILGSGVFETGTASHALRSYLGQRGETHLPPKLLDAYGGKSVPLLIWTAEYDPLASGAKALKDKLCAKYGACPMFVELQGHNHVSPVMSIDSSDRSVMNQVIRFYHSAVKK